jgi:hypothetical protein
MSRDAVTAASLCKEVSVQNRYHKSEQRNSLLLIIALSSLIWKDTGEFNNAYWKV